MPLTLPNLDDRTYADLLAEARAMIPAIAPDWTDHNPADPGITLVELFAWLTEMLLYRVNQVTDEHRLAFLRLINGPEWQRNPHSSVADEVRATVLALRQPGRAVTADDFERLALGVPGVARAHCLPRRNVKWGDHTKRASDAPADVSVVIVGESGCTKVAEDLLADVEKALEPARLLTTRLHVVVARRISITVALTIRGRGGVVAKRDPVIDPRPGMIAISLTIHGRADTVEVGLLADAEGKLKAFFDPHPGGTDRRGWPLGRSVYLSEIYDLLARLPGADYVTPTEGRPELVADADDKWRLRDQADGKLASIELILDELPALEIAAGKIDVTAPAPR